MLEVQAHGNIWMVVRKNSEGTVSVIKSFRRQASAIRLLMRLYEEGAV